MIMTEFFFEKRKEFVAGGSQDKEKSNKKVKHNNILRIKYIHRRKKRTEKYKEGGIIEKDHGTCMYRIFAEIEQLYLDIKTL